MLGGNDQRRLAAFDVEKIDLEGLGGRGARGREAGGASRGREEARDFQCACHHVAPLLVGCAQKKSP